MSKESNNGDREKFASRLGFILVSAGCAIGLGNVWKFPYICGQNGGAIFIVIYLLCLLLLGYPILTCEFAIGRGSGKSVGSALKELAPKGGNWHKFSWYAYAGNYLLMMFYTMVAGWMVYYVYVMGSGQLHGGSVEAIEDKFTGMLASPGLYGRNHTCGHRVLHRYMFTGTSERSGESDKGNDAGTHRSDDSHGSEFAHALGQRRRT